MDNKVRDYKTRISQEQIDKCLTCDKKKCNGDCKDIKVKGENENARI